MLSNYEKSVASWVWPGIFSGMAWVALAYAYEVFGPALWLMIIAVLAVVTLAACFANAWEYFRERQMAALDARHITLSQTADSVLMKEARLLATQSPELAGELARRVGRPDLIMFASRQGRQAQIRLAGSDVTLQFAIKALQLSDDVHFVAQRNFGEASYLYDPNMDIQDRKQWMQLNWILSREGMCQRYAPNVPTNSAPMWLPPWTAQRVLDNWLLPEDVLKIFRIYLNVEE